MPDERIDILNAEGLLTGKTEMKSKAHKVGLWHASAQIWIYTPTGKILLQQRAAIKDTYPNLWDISVAGHLSAGDTAITAAIREIKEEIGLSISAEALHYLKTIKRSKRPTQHMQDNEFNHLFICRLPIVIADLKLQKEEVADIQLMTLKDFKTALKNRPEEFVPHGEEYYSFIIDSITSALDAQQK